MTLKSKLAGRTNPTRKEPLWKGPEIDGVTQSLLSRFLVCRERFRVYAIEGLRHQEGFNARMEYGNMWHVCEEAYLDYQEGSWQEALRDYAKNLYKSYPLQHQEITKWYKVCLIHFPIYLKYWEKHPDQNKLQPLVEEEVFVVNYKLPSGRTVILRGKWDSVDEIESGPNKGVWLKENKTKSEIDSIKLERQLTFDLQSMFYSVALVEWLKTNSLTKRRYVGVRYNVIRRPLSGGKGTIKQHKPSKSCPQGETEEEYYNRLQDILESCPDEYFARWNVLIPLSEINKFREQCLNPVLEQLCDWYQHMVNCCKGGENPFTNEPYHIDGPRTPIHWRHPFGVYNPMDEGNNSDLDNYLDTGNMVGLVRVNTLFRELEDA